MMPVWRTSNTMPDTGLLAGRCYVASIFLVARGVVQQTAATEKVEDPSHGQCAGCLHTMAVCSIKGLITTS